MNKYIFVLLVVLLSACAGQPTVEPTAQPTTQAISPATEQTFVVVEKLVVVTRIVVVTPIESTQTQLPEETATPDGLNRIPHVKSTAYPQIPNHAPDAFESVPDGAGDAMIDQRYAYFEQMVCVDYVDLRTAPMLTQSPRAYVVYGDVLHVHERWGEWAFVEGQYWIELKYLCDF